MDDIDDDYIFSDPRCNWIAVESDPEAAAHILTVAAEYLRECQGKGFPADLAGYLAKAFETAVAQEPKKRLAALGRALHLTAGHKRPTSKVSWCDVGHEVGTLICCDGMSQNKALDNVSEKYDISFRTAERMLMEYRKACEKSRADE